MTLEPVAAAPLAIQVHLVTVLAAAGLGLWLLAQPKGTPVHRITGRVWMALMVVAALSSFLIPATLLRVVGPFGAIHGLSVLVLVMVTLAIRAARAGRIRAHRGFVIGLYVGAILGAGGGALVPGRMISRILGYA
ncbi:MAG: DUF2306 domain-containing protein [Alphaproteobacteria bacterium]|nr:DUF2306 domain-containing protein [Alphaproteobacteria bacterium]MCW5741672.1 DUF2306 domain-containing protein [Alphaproteobacteria bacterium]